MNGAWGEGAVVVERSAGVLADDGVGVDPTTISFGTMINAARMEMAREPMVWWALLAAFSFMFALVLSANLFADAVQNALDPRTRTLRKSHFFQRMEKKEIGALNKPAQTTTPSEPFHRP